MVSTVRVGALFPMIQTSGNFDQSGMLRLGAFLLALKEINESPTLLPNTTLQFVLRDSRRDSLAALVGALELTGSCSNSGGGSAGIVAAVGAASSGPSESAASAFAQSRVPQISYSSTSPTLSDGSNFPFFLRTPPSDAFQAEAMVDVLSNLFNYSHVATVRSTDSYGMNGISAFSQLWTAQNRTILTSQSFSSGETDFSLVYHEIQRVRARVVVLFCQANDAGRFLRGAYEAGVGGDGWFVLGSDAVASPATWLNDEALHTNLTLRHAALSGFVGLTPSNGAGTARYDAYRTRLLAFSPSVLPRLDSATPGTPSAVPCDVVATRAASHLWNATDADGRPIWLQPIASGETACVAPIEPLADNSYAPYGLLSGSAACDRAHLPVGGAMDLLWALR